MASLPPTPEEESVPADDRIIGKAIRASLVALVILAALFGAAVLMLKRKAPPAAPQLTVLSAPASPARAETDLPDAKFTDVTRESGIAFVHINGAYGEKLLPETMGGGVAFLDYDNDGHQDLLFINSTYWPGHVPENKPLPTPALYHNDGRGHFTNATPGSGLDISCYGMGVAIGDYDSDGFDDVLITGVGGNRLFRNSGGGKFQEVTVEAGVGGGHQRLDDLCGLRRLRQ
jgi:hypothetical protein